MDSYQRSAAEFRKLAGLDEAEEPRNQGRILPSIVNYVTRRPA
jgi:hypothetical protein